MNATTKNDRKESRPRNPELYRLNDETERKKLAEVAALNMLDHAIATRKTINYLVEKGFSSDEASATVTRLKRLNSKTKERKAHRMIFTGVISLLTGALIWQLPIVFMDKTIFLGLVALLCLWGGIQLIKGLLKSLKKGH